ncbi:MAG: PepSY-like domain-containing protein [Bacteroidales bacterium]|nr:PepSY-like domain-containing protein [Bacteroidales bacterium]MBR3466985.1 PepSY-like domain-containing protein [Bacteroidales bacterium]
MKKLLVLLLCVAAVNVYAVTDRPVTFAQLPQKAQQFITKHFSGVEFLSGKQDDGEYEVYLTDGTEIDFTAAGDWKDVDCHTRAVPAAIVPAAISKYVKAKFPNNTIVKISKKYAGYDIELDSDLELKFDKNGNFMTYDD